MELEEKDCYKSVAIDYDKFHKVQSQALANFILTLIEPLSTADDQIVDVGGGTGQCSSTLKKAMGMTKPVVCIDPSRAMLDVAMETGAITIQSTAEGFFASKPIYPLDLVIMNGCVHLFEKPDFVFSKLAEYMPENGVCVVAKYASSSALPLFKAAKRGFATTDNILEETCKLIDSKGLRTRMTSHMELLEMDKTVWYGSIRSRYSTPLMKMSDQELEEGIRELEEEFKDKSVLAFEAVMTVIVVTRK